MTQAAVDSKGTDFIFAFTPNLNGTGTLSLFITGEQDTQGIVEIPGLNVQTSFSVTANQITTVPISLQAQQLPNNRISNLGVKVSAESEITVYGLNQKPATTDAFLALPIDALGLEYRTMSYSVRDWDWPSQFAITGAFDGTQVTIVPSAHAGPNGFFIARRAGVPFTITLNKGQTYFLTGRNGADLIGTRITATAPVAVTSGDECTYVPTNRGFCDHLIEMIPPVASWGESFLTVPSATRKGGDIFRILASQNNTQIRINGQHVYTLNAGKFYQDILSVSSQIETSAPVLVSQFARGTATDGVIGDPYMMLIPPTEQFLQNYTFSTPATRFEINYVNIVAPTAEIGSIFLDGQPVDNALFKPIGSSGFSGAQVPVSKGAHTLVGGVPFGIYVYGFAAHDSYGYPGGMAFEFINPTGDSFAPNVRLTPVDDTIVGIATDSEDINANGALDTGEDLNSNGLIGRRSEDINGNGVLDAGEDLNSNGLIDRDTGIFRIELDPGFSNLQLDVPSFTPGALRVDFTITVIDRNQPGVGVLRIVDGAGNTKEVPIDLSLVPTLSDVQVISTLSSDSIELDEDSLSVPPYNVTIVDGNTVIEWRFDRIAVDEIQDIDFDIILRNPVPGEQRLVSQKLEVIYTDVNGNEVHTELGPQFVNVSSSIFRLSIDTDRSSYTANEQVVITGQLENLSDAAATTSLHITIRDAQGILVSDLGVIADLTLGPNETQSLSGTDFFIGALLEGQYEVHVELLDDSGQPIALAVAPFLVVTPSAQKLSAGITTDKQTYAPLETVAIQNRIINQTPNAILENLTAVTTVYDPDNQVFFSQSTAIPQLLPNALRDINYDVPLGQALPGVYRLMLVVKDADDVERALAETTITLLSTAETGSGLAGQLAVVPTPVLKTEFVSLKASVENLGNSNVANLPLTLSIIDPASQQVITQWTETVGSLTTQGEHLFERQWQAIGTIGSTFIAVLQADIGGETRLLAQNSFVIGSKIDSEFAQGSRGRLLVLLDSERCSGLTSLELDAALSSLAADATVTVEAFNAQGMLIDSETVSLSNFADVVNLNPGVDTDLLITELTTNGLGIRLQATGSSTAKLESEYSIVANIQNNGTVLRIESGAVHTSCSQPVSLGDVHGSFEISGFTTIPATDGRPANVNQRGVPTLAQQHQFLETLLQREGWSYTIVTDSNTFAHELRSGGYVQYALLSRHMKLDEQVQKELREAVYRGEGLLVAGRHDHRNGRIDDALGVKFKGKHAKATGMALSESVLHTAAETTFATGDKRLRVELAGAEVVGRFQFAAGQAPKQAGRDAAVTINSYGAGRSVYNGFNLLAESTVSGDGSLLAELLSNTLGHIHPDTLIIRAGGVVPLRLTLTNNGTPSSGRVVISPPPGGEVIDGSGGTVDASGTLIIPFTLATGALAEFDVWIRLPVTTEPVSIEALIQVGQAPTFADHNTITFTITPVADTTFADVIATIDAVSGKDNRISQARKHVQRAEREWNTGNITDALKALLKAADALMASESSESPNMRRQIDQLIWQLARQL